MSTVQWISYLTATTLDWWKAQLQLLSLGQRQTSASSVTLSFLTASRFAGQGFYWATVQRASVKKEVVSKRAPNSGWNDYETHKKEIHLKMYVWVCAEAGWRDSRIYCSSWLFTVAQEGPPGAVAGHRLICHVTVARRRASVPPSPAWSNFLS